MTAADLYSTLPDAVTDVFGPDATAAHAYDLLTVDVPAASWIAALETARSELGCTYFDWLSAVDEPGTGFRVCAHVAALGDGTVRRLLIRTTVPHDAATLPTAVGVYAGAAWHERETHEMFGIGFEDHPHLVPLLLPESFEGHPLRKDFVLAARVAKAWPGAKEPGESEHGGPKRRTMLPPGVPDPNEWGPLKGQLPPAPARPARGARAAGDRPVRRTRSASEGSAAQRPDAVQRPDAEETPQAAAPPRRSRSASQGSASQQPPVPPAPATPAETPGRAQDAPWHDARPAFDEPSDAAREPGEPEAPAESAEPEAPAEPEEPGARGESQPLRRLRSGGPGAEPPVREGAGRGEAPRSATPDAPAPEPPAEQTTEAPETSEAPDTPEAPETPEAPRPPDKPDPPAGGDTA
ncbi:NADH-quinone oxidoreductase subunit C [Streptomyces sp. NPDC102451]|uniref:NADH-quinone oxidoreductase subunit C n=1 Tax=Streptomyces sp. NPDC102451 TaxID=3366177 RepID=UPI0037FA8895